MTTESKFNRTKFKDSTTSESLKAADKTVESTIRSGQQGNYAGFLTIENGVNKFVLMPSHETIQQMMPGGEDVKNEPFVVPKQVYWLPREVDDKDDKGNVKKDKKGNPLKKIINARVFDARIHSEAKRDIVDFYINVYKKQLEEEFGTDKAAEEIIKEKMLIINGSYQKRIQGIVGKPAWVVYAEKIVGEQRTFGRLEMGKAVKLRLNELIAIEESNAPIGSESNNPFTDIENRRALIVKYNDQANDAKLYYITEIDSAIDKDPKSPTYKQIATYPISDAQLEQFLKYPSLSSLYKNCYTKKDFDLAIEGLRLFDEKNELGVFANQDFIDEAAAMRDIYPDAKEEGATEETASTEEDGKDKFEAMDREELKNYSRTNKTGIAIHSKLSDDDIRNLLREWEKSQGGEEAEQEEGPKTDIDEILDSRPSAQGVKVTDSKGQSAKDRIAEIRSGKKK